VSISYAIGIDAGGTNVKGVAMDRSGGILLRRCTDVGERMLPDAVEGMYSALQPLLGSAPKHVCVAAPGIVSADGRSIWWMQGRLSELQDVDWSELKP
jgi:glucokinase